MPAKTIQHEAWCANHADEMGEEVCESEPIQFGPDYSPAGRPKQPLGEIFAYRVEGEDEARFVLESGGRGHSSISMRPRELHALHSLLQQCPDDLGVAISTLVTNVLEGAPS